MDLAVKLKGNKKSNYQRNIFTKNIQTVQWKQKSPQTEYAHSQIILSNVNLFKEFTQGHVSCV